RRFGRSPSFGAEEVGVGFCGGGLFGADDVAACEESGERFVGFDGTRTAREEPAAQRCGSFEPFFAIDLDAADADIEGEENDGEFEEPVPEVARLEGALAVVEEGIGGGRARS